MDGILYLLQNFAFFLKKDSGFPTHTQYVKNDVSFARMTALSKNASSCNTCAVCEHISKHVKNEVNVKKI